MKISIIFRGDNLRYQDGIALNSCLNVSNWKKTIFDDLREAGHNIDIVFITYPSAILDELTTLIAPSSVILIPNISQSYNFNQVGKYITDNSDNYDRFIILRFDLIYKMRITNWNKWYKDDLVLCLCPDQDNNYRGWVNDFMFIVDKNRIYHFTKGIEFMSNYNGNYKLPHFIGEYFLNNNLEIDKIYNDDLPDHDNPLWIWTKRLIPINKDIIDNINRKIL